MKPLILPLTALWAALAASGCSATYPVVFDHETKGRDTVTLARLNRRLSERSVVVHQRSGQDLEGVYVGSSYDSTSLVPTGVTTPRALANSAIKSIEFRDHWDGVLGGFFLGFFGGLAGGALVVLAAGYSAGLGALMLGGMTWLLSMVAGPIVGGITGIPNTLEFPVLSTAPDAVPLSAERARYPAQKYFEDSAHVFWTWYPYPFGPPGVRDSTMGKIPHPVSFYCDLADTVTVSLLGEQDSVVYAARLLTSHPHYFGLIYCLAGPRYLTAKLPAEYLQGRGRSYKILLSVRGRPKCIETTGIYVHKGWYWWLSEGAK